MSPRAWIELVLLATLWGGSFLTVRIALNEIGPLTAVAHRTFWALPVLWAWVVLRGHVLPRDPRHYVGFLGMGLLNNLLPFSLMAWGQLHIPSGLTSILNAGTAVFGVLLAALVLKDERLSSRKALGIALGFLGVATAIGLDALRAFDITSLAQLAVLAGAVCYATAGIWARLMLDGLAPEVQATGMVTASTMMAVPLAWIVEGPISLSLAPATWAAIGYYALLSTAVAYLLYYRVLAMAGSGNLMLTTLLVSPIAIVLGAVVLGEALPPHAYLGFACLVAGLLVIDGRIDRAVSRRLRRFAAHPAPPSQGDG